MAAIADQLEDDLPPDRIRTGIRVQSIHPGGVELKTGEHIDGSVVVLATDSPETARRLEVPGSIGSRGEWCVYFAAEASPIDGPYLVLNGNGTGWINSLTVPSTVAPSYSPAGQHWYF